MANITGQWSKYGGGRRRIKQSLDKIWYCQSCGQEQPSDLTPNLFRYQNEHLRLCGVCIQDGGKLKTNED